MAKADLGLGRPAGDYTGALGLLVFVHNRGYAKAKADLNDERELARFREVYAPLIGLFLNCHIATFTSFRAPYFRQRWANAKRTWRHSSPWRTAKALFDRMPRTTAEVEYGRSFTLSEIKAQLREREQYADAELMCMVKAASLSRYEDNL